MKRKLLLLFFYILLINPLLAINEKTGLVLSGGGVKGLAHIGTLKVIDSLNINIDYIAGTSIGSIAAALYASSLFFFTFSNLFPPPIDLFFFS